MSLLLLCIVRVSRFRVVGFFRVLDLRAVDVWGWRFLSLNYGFKGLGFRFSLYCRVCVGIPSA